MNSKSILHMSDLHMGRNGATTAGATAAISSVIERWAATPEKPVVVITGDIVQSGKKNQFELAKVEIERLRAAGFQVFPVLGNHDYGENGSHADRDSFALFKEAFYPQTALSFPYELRVDKWLIILVDSMQAELGPLDRFGADGEVGVAQREALSTLLDAAQADRATGTKVVLGLHHHPFIFPDASLFKQLGEWATHWLKDGAALMSEIRGRVDVLLFGHDHRAWDFSNELGGKVLTEDYQIPVILSCGTSSGVADLPGQVRQRDAYLVKDTPSGLQVEAVHL